MRLITALRINMTGRCEDPAEEAERYRAAVEMAAFADVNGFDVVNVEEHHCAGNGWLPSPLTMAAMIVARTERVSVNVTALLVTLYDPIRLAEDIAVLDLASGGRMSFVCGLGYRPVEYHAMDKRWEDRGKLMDHVIGTLLEAWSGEPFEYNGEVIRVTPVPVTKPHPLIFIGGMSEVAARRAARFGLPFYPPMKMPALEAVYREELDRHGKTGFVYYPDEGNSMLFIDEEPERAWDELAPCFLRETQEYSRWKREGVPRPSEQDITTIEELRSQGRYEILSPQQCLDRIRKRGQYTAVLHPLAGGIPLDRGWRSLELFTERVLGPLAAER